MRSPRHAVRIVLAAGATAALCGGQTVPAQAAGMPSPTVAAARQLSWKPYRTGAFESPAGQTCAFTLRGDPVKDREEIATWATYADGSPRLQTIRGDLRVRYTNVESGATVERDLFGVGTIAYGRDGSTTLYLVGPAAVGFKPTDPYPAGFYALDGFHVVYTAPERVTRQMVVDAGTEHDICGDLD